VTNSDVLRLFHRTQTTDSKIRDWQQSHQRKSLGGRAKSFERLLVFLRRRPSCNWSKWLGRLCKKPRHNKLEVLQVAGRNSGERPTGERSSFGGSLAGFFARRTRERRFGGEMASPRRRASKRSCATPSTLQLSDTVAIVAGPGRFAQPSATWRIGSQEGSPMGDDRSKDDATEECLDLANRCLIEASRTLDREAAHTLRHLAKQYFKEAGRHKEG
jgi:hypothetical protein